MNAMKVLGDRLWLIVPLSAVMPCAVKGKYPPDVFHRHNLS
jgi:hypothetical protein